MSRPILTLGAKKAPASPAKPLIDALRRMSKNPKYVLNEHALARAAADIEVTEKSLGPEFNILQSNAYRKALRVYEAVTGERWTAPSIS